MKSQGEFLGEVASLLDEAQVRYMVTGSIASTYHGRPRATQDVDVVVETNRDPLLAFVRACAARGFYVDAEDAKDAMVHRSIFNVIDASSGYKVDIIVRKDRPFSVEEFSRRRRVELPTFVVSMVTAEDAILSKLEWSQAGGSDRRTASTKMRWGSPYPKAICSTSPISGGRRRLRLAPGQLERLAFCRARRAPSMGAGAHAAALDRGDPATSAVRLPSMQDANDDHPVVNPEDSAITANS